MVCFLTCPACGFQMDKTLFRREGFRCPNCQTFLHGAEWISYIIALAAIVLAALISYLFGLQDFKLVLGTAVISILLFLLGCAITGLYFPKLAIGLPSNGRITLRIPPPDEPTNVGNAGQSNTDR